MSLRLTGRSRGRTLIALVASWAILSGPSSTRAFAADHDDSPTNTPLKHVVVIFQENVSFDHYFGTYPRAANNSPNEPEFHARPGTPTVNGLNRALLLHNPNSANPFRLARTRAATCDQNHDYGDEQKAYHAGLVDAFVEVLGTGPGTDGTLICAKSDVMGYFDGNTVTALCTYAQHFAMSDNSFGTVFGPSTPGALNLVSGQTNGATPADLPGSVVQGSVVGDPRPFLDDCSPGGGEKPNQLILAGSKVGDLLNHQNITWGRFQGGFRPTKVVNGKAVCGSVLRSHGQRWFA
jgi:phospholipase C